MALDQHGTLLKMVVMVSQHHFTGRPCWSWLSWCLCLSSRLWPRAPLVSPRERAASAGEKLPPPCPPAEARWTEPALCALSLALAREKQDLLGMRQLPDQRPSPPLPLAQALPRVCCATRACPA